MARLPRHEEGRATPSGRGGTRDPIGMWRRDVSGATPSARGGATWVARFPRHTQKGARSRPTPSARGGDARSTHLLPCLNWPLPASLAAAFALARRSACFDLGGIAVELLHGGCEGNSSQARICMCAAIVRVRLWPSHSHGAVAARGTMYKSVGWRHTTYELCARCFVKGHWHLLHVHRTPQAAHVQALTRLRGARAREAASFTRAHHFSVGPAPRYAISSQEQCKDNRHIS